MNLPKVVIDTNILLVSFATFSPYRWIFDALLERKFVLCITIDILLEYAEIIERHHGEVLATTIL